MIAGFITTAKCKSKSVDFLFCGKNYAASICGGRGEIESDSEQVIGREAKTAAFL